MLHVRLAQDGVSHGGRSSGRDWTSLSFLLFVSREVSLCEREDQLSLELDGSVAPFFTGRPHNVDLR